jgi:hypothetical protein
MLLIEEANSQLSTSEGISSRKGPPPHIRIRESETLQLVGVVRYPAD